MNPLVSANRLFSSLFDDPQIAAEFSTERFCRHFLSCEIALTEALAESGMADRAVATAAVSAMQGFKPDLDAIEQSVPVDGLAVPEFMRQLKAQLGPDLVPAVHIGATSQDLIDTAMVLAIRATNNVLADRLQTVTGMLDDLITRHGENQLMGRTHMQAALPISVRHRLESWQAPLTRHQARLAQMRPGLEVLQFGGAAGDRGALGPQGMAVGAALAHHLGLTDPGRAWHNDRDGFAEYASWLSMVTGALGKIGQDICLMAQQGVDALDQSGGGTSSAMAHKQNPVKAELLVTLARYNSGQLSLMHSALIHEQERSGVAWTLEWLALPAMACATGKSLALAAQQMRAITRIGSPPTN